MARRPPRRTVRIEDVEYGYSISQERIARALDKVNRYSLIERLRRLDDVNAAQPELFGAVFDVMRQGVNAKTTDHAVQVLLVLFECFLELAPDFPKIPRPPIDRSLLDLKNLSKFLDAPPLELPEPLAHPWASRHAEHHVVCFVVDHLRRTVPDQIREHHFIFIVSLAVMNTYLDTLATLEVDPELI